MSKLLLSASIALICAGSAQAASLTRSSTVAPQANAPAVACPSGPGSLTYNTDCTPVTGTIACADQATPQTPNDNSYYRRYVLSPNSLPNVQISTVRLGIEAASGAPAGLMANLYTIPDGAPFLLANLTQIGSAPIPVTAGAALTEVVVTISPAAVVDTPATKNIVVELFEPDFAGAATATAVFFGSNATGTGVTYLRSTECALDEPTDIASIGTFGNVKIIASLSGAGLPVELQDYKVD